MTPSPESPDAAREPGWRFQIVSDGDVRAYAPNGETWRVMAGTREPFLEFVHALFTHLATAPDITRLTAERDAALRDAERLRVALVKLLDMDVAYGRGMVVEDAVEDARAALSAQERGNV